MAKIEKRQNKATKSKRSLEPQQETSVAGGEASQETTSQEFTVIHRASRERWELILGQVQEILARELPKEFQGYNVREISFTKSNSVCVPTVYYDSGSKCIVIGRVCFES